MAGAASMPHALLPASLDAAPGSTWMESRGSSTVHLALTVPACKQGPFVGLHCPLDRHMHCFDAPDQPLLIRCTCTMHVRLPADTAQAVAHCSRAWALQGLDLQEWAGCDEDQNRFCWGGFPRSVPFQENRGLLAPEVCHTSAVTCFLAPSQPSCLGYPCCRNDASWTVRPLLT